MPQSPDITTTGAVGALPGSPGGTIAPTAGTVYTAKASATQEYVAGSVSQAYSGFLRSLSFAIDDVESDFGSDLYARMQFDPRVKGNLRLIKSAILSEELSLVPAVNDESEDGFAQAQDILTFCDRVLANLETPLEDVLRDMLDAVALGNQVAEQVYDQPTRGVDRGKLVLTKLKVKPRGTTAFVVDAFRNVVGLLAYIPGVGFPVTTGGMIDPAHQANFLPREKFAVLTWEPKDGDPRGSSSLRSAYWPWQAKLQVAMAYLSYLAKFASPSVWATVGPESASSTTINADGTLSDASPVQALYAQLLNFQNGSALALANGSAVGAVHVQGNGEAFLKAFDWFDAQITYGMLSQTLATGEGQHQARAAAAVHQDVLSLLIREGKNAVCRMVRRDILMPLVQYNFGEQCVSLTPKATLGEVENRDVSTLVTALAAAGYVIANSQLPEIDALLGLAQRSKEDLQEAEVIAEGGSTDGSAPAPPTAPPGTATPATPPGTPAPPIVASQPGNPVKPKE